MKETRAQPGVDALRARIRSAGLRLTAPRIAVLRRLEQARTPLSHAELMEDLGPQGWDRATVYRNLSDLTDAGIVRRTDVGDHVWRYELRRDEGQGQDAAEHPHFMCVTCGEVKCLPGLKVEFSGTNDTSRSLVGRAIEVQVKGLCERCA